MKKTKTLKRRPKPTETGGYLVVQSELRSGPRTVFESETEAYEEAHYLLTGKRVYPGYRPPPKLLVVRIVGGVEARTVTRRIKP